jgi:hypothetical protein
MSEHTASWSFAENSESEDAELGQEADTPAPESVGTDISAKLWPKVEWFFASQPSEEALELLQPTEVPQWGDELPVVSPRASPVEVVSVPAVARLSSLLAVEPSSNTEIPVPLDPATAVEGPSAEASAPVAKGPSQYELELASLQVCDFSNPCGPLSPIYVNCLSRSV